MNLTFINYIAIFCFLLAEQIQDSVSNISFIIYLIDSLDIDIEQ